MEVTLQELFDRAFRQCIIVNQLPPVTHIKTTLSEVVRDNPRHFHQSVIDMNAEDLDYFHDRLFKYVVELDRQELTARSREVYRWAHPLEMRSEIYIELAKQYNLILPYDEKSSIQHPSGYTINRNDVVAESAYNDQQRAEILDAWEDTPQDIKISFLNWLAEEHSANDAPQEWVDFANRIALWFLKDHSIQRALEQ